MHSINSTSTKFKYKNSIKSNKINKSNVSSASTELMLARFFDGNEIEFPFSN